MLSVQALLGLFALLTIIPASALGSALQARDNGVTMPAPLAFSPDENWDGIDGKWSSFTLRVGTPAQFVRTFISFLSYQTLVIAPEGCDTAADPDACGEARGWIFERNDSSTWDYIGIYETYIEKDMGIDPTAIYGYDVVGLGGEGEGGPTLQNTTVGSVALLDYYIGLFGINPKPSNFTSFSDGSPSYITLLKEQGHIPSVSWGYTAGAPYRFSGVLASLTLGGYDSSRYIPNNVTFTFAADNEHDLLVAIQSITTPSKTLASPTATELLPSPVYALIDSTLPMLYLPEEACQAFELEFGLIYDDTTSLYLVNDTLHEELLERNASVTIALAQGFIDTDSVKITLPYAAFDLVAKPPFTGLQNDTNYFPLQRAANETQYRLGRVFLQEAYITVAYEVSRFQVNPVLWNQNPVQYLVAIQPANTSNPSGDWTSSTWSQAEGSENGTSSSAKSHSGSGGISGGAIGGIVVGVLAIIAALAGFWFWRRKRDQRRKQAAIDEKATARVSAGSASDSEGGRSLQQDSVYPKAELAGSGPLPFGMTHHEADKNGLPTGSTPTSRSGTPFTPTTAMGSALWGHSPTTPSAGEGTHASSQSGTLFSPATAPSEAGSRAIYEMPGDMPIVREKDGKQLSEKEALRYRENVYNGVDSSAASSPTSGAGPEEGERQDRRVNPEDVVDAETGEHITRHRAFSFEGSADESNEKP